MYPPSLSRLSVLALLFCAAGIAQGEAAPQAPKLEQDSGQVNIQQASKDPDSVELPILVDSFTGNSGSKRCRGHIMSSLTLPKPASLHTETTCYNLPRTARCARFIANKADGCEARLYNMDDCPESPETFVNTIVFWPEDKPVGGQWKSFSVRCGVKPPDVHQLSAESILKMFGGSGKITQHGQR